MISNNIKIENTNNSVIRIIKGVVISFIVTVISILVFSIILAYSNISEEIIPVVIIILSFVSILIGTIIGVRKISRNGMLNGALIGGIYVISLYIISSLLNTGFVFNNYTILMIIAGIVSGIIGGIIGVNT